ncbi:MAG: SurA N-terminal domain-containing protein [Nitrospiria bacterium]
MRRAPNPKSLVYSVVLAGFVFVSPVFGVTLAEVNKTPISDAVVRERLQSYLRQIGHEKLSPVRMATLRKAVLKKLIEEELLYQDGLTHRIAVSESEIVAGVLKVQNRFASAEAFHEALSEEDLNLEDIRKGVSRSIVIQKSWARFSKMSEPDRASRLREMTEGADIRVFNVTAPVASYK